MQRHTWLVAVMAVVSMLYGVYERNERLSAEDFANKTARTLEHLNRVNQKAIAVLDSCMETNNILTFNGQEKLKKLFSDDADRLQEVGSWWKKAQKNKRLFASTPAGMEAVP
jgi:hypothetical protein